MREERQREGGRGREGRQGERGQSQPEKPYFKTKEVAGGKEDVFVQARGSL